MNTRLFFALATLLVAQTASAAPVLAPLDSPPVEGRASRLRLLETERPVAGAAVTAVYRENAHGSLRREQAVGVTDADGAVTWTPDAAGVVVLTWEGGSRNVSVLHDGAPFGGVLVAVLAGLALLGGSVLFFLLMLRQPESELIAELEEYGEPPST